MVLPVSPERGWLFGPPSQVYAFRCSPFESSAPGAGRRWWGQACWVLPAGTGVALAARGAGLVARRLPGVFGASSACCGTDFPSACWRSGCGRCASRFSPCCALFRRFQRWEEGLERRLADALGPPCGVVAGAAGGDGRAYSATASPSSRRLSRPGSQHLDRWFGLRFPLRSEAELATQALP